jgi:hypothetical protein
VFSPIFAAGEVQFSQVSKSCPRRLGAGHQRRRPTESKDRRRVAVYKLRRPAGQLLVAVQSSGRQCRKTRCQNSFQNSMKPDTYIQSGNQKPFPSHGGRDEFPDSRLYSRVFGVASHVISDA